MTNPEALVEADTCLVCDRTADQHDMGTGLPTCRGIAVPTFRSRHKFEAEVLERAASVCERRVEIGMKSSGVVNNALLQALPDAIRALSQGERT